MYKCHMKIFFVLWLSLLATVSLAAQQMIPGTLQVNGVDRTYLLHVPAGDQNGKPLPLVLVHGAQMTAALMARITGMNAWADKTDFIVVYPQGLEQHWNTTQQPGATADDFIFMKELITKIESAYSVNRSRVFAAGLSNGAEFAQGLACSGDFQFAAVVAVSATLQKEGAKYCVPRRTVRMIEFHGTADPIVPYAGGRVAAPGGPIVLSVADDLRLWQQIDHCAPDPKTDRLPDSGGDGTHVERVTFHGCAAGGEVTHYRILGGGHVWPGYSNTPKILGQTTQQIDASRYIAHLVSGDVEP
jgi:polyhydroxybutyrate depolymerase